MSAKIPRRTFAASLVVTVAVPACLVSSGKPATTPQTGDDSQVISNPPRPTGGTAEPAPPPPAKPPHAEVPGNDTVQTPPPPAPTQQQAPMRTWNVTLQGKDCFAGLDVQCPPKGATCNPPPPTKLARCPEGITVARPYQIKEDPANTCALYYPMPDCPAGVACNPPRPQKIECPTR